MIQIKCEQNPSRDMYLLTVREVTGMPGMPVIISCVSSFKERKGQFGTDWIEFYGYDPIFERDILIASVPKDRILNRRDGENGELFLEMRS